MCLYPKLIKNPKYLPNKKNGGLIPYYEDDRVLYVPIGCGKCMECKRQKAREWQVRLAEELKVTKYAYFITLTFSCENLERLMKEYKCGETNAVATIAVRRFLERWRKHYKKSLRHWLITELGHENTERIHLHGILFSEFEITNETLAKYWKYGRTDTGKYCNQKSINYIVKYVTKTDQQHKKYEPVILCSAGLGRNFADEEYNKYAHRYKPRTTIEYYKLNNGARVNMPIYYRNKFYTEEQRELLWLEKLDKHTIYVNGIKCDELDTNAGRENYENVVMQQRIKNREFGYGDDTEEWKKEPYNITLKMLNKAKNEEK